MGVEGSDLPLSQVEVLAVDCQATSAAPRGQLIELGWARVGTAVADTHSSLVSVPDGERIPPAVARITGITDRMTLAGIPPDAAWRELAGAAGALDRQPAPTVIHFARFERPFLDRLSGGAPPLDIVCTHEVAKRLLPELPRRSLRALAGYFGRAVGVLRRSADHVEATAFVWRELVHLLEAQGVGTWSDLRGWLASPVEPTNRRRRVWPMPREARLSLPDLPGVYRLLRTSGDVLYVGKASSLRNRVNSHFRHQRGVPERMLEMLSQARGVTFDLTQTALEAALVEPDEIKRHHPPYNIALTDGDREVWFAPPDLSDRRSHPSRRFRIGPFPSADMLDRFAAMARGSRMALGDGRWAPDEPVFNEGFARFRAAHEELSSGTGGMPARLLRLGSRLWRDGMRDRDEDVDPSGDEDAFVAIVRRAPTWTADVVQRSLERIALRAALSRRRAAWLTRLVDASLTWSEPGDSRSRMLVIEGGDIMACDAADSNLEPPVPPSHARSIADRHAAFTLARFDRLRVLTTEIKRLVSMGAPVTVRFGQAPALSGGRLATALSWL